MSATAAASCGAQASQPPHTPRRQGGGGSRSSHRTRCHNNMDSSQKKRRTTAATAEAAAAAERVAEAVVITPEYLHFPPPHCGRCVQTELCVRNTATQPCVYKLQTQHPSWFVAAPSVAVVAPRGVVRIHITLRDMGMHLCNNNDNNDNNDDNNNKEEEAAVDDVTWGEFAATTQTRFRLSIKLVSQSTARKYKLDTTSSSLPPSSSSTTTAAATVARCVWRHTADTTICIRDVVAYFGSGVPPPPDSVVTFLPSDYVVRHTAEQQRGECDERQQQQQQQQTRRKATRTRGRKCTTHTTHKTHKTKKTTAAVASTAPFGGGDEADGCAYVANNNNNNNNGCSDGTSDATSSSTTSSSTTAIMMQQQQQQSPRNCSNTSDGNVRSSVARRPRTRVGDAGVMNIHIMLHPHGSGSSAAYMCGSGGDMSDSIGHASSGVHHHHSSNSNSSSNRSSSAWCYYDGEATLYTMLHQKAAHVRRLLCRLQRLLTVALNVFALSVLLALVLLYVFRRVTDEHAHDATAMQSLTVRNGGSSAVVAAPAAAAAAAAAAMDAELAHLLRTDG